MIPPLTVVLAWPLIAISFFRSMSLPVAVSWCLIAGYLFLPERGSIDLPLLPAIDKDSIPSLVAIAAILILKPAISKNVGDTVLSGWLPRNRLIWILLIGLIVSSMLTVLANQDAIVAENVFLPPLNLYDSFSAILTTIMAVLPFLLARRHLAAPAQHRDLLRVLCTAGLIYTLPIIFEIIMSPKLSLMIYGFFPHSFLQHVRSGGYRPVVFLHHGLWLAIFMAGTVLAAFALYRAQKDARKGTYFLAALWLLFILFMCRSLGAFAITLILLPVILFFNARTQVIFAAVIAALILVYPSLRGAGIIPVDQVNRLAASISEDRSASFRYRLTNEEILLEKANKRPFFGWGGWGRSLIYDEEGRMTSTADGMWVIVIGRDGWVGYICRFGLFCAPIILLALRRRKYTLHPETAGLGLIMVAYMIDLIPNASLTPMTWLIAGALAGRLELTNSDLASAPTEDGEEENVERVRYSRFPPKAATVGHVRQRGQAVQHSRTQPRESRHGS
ncbi:hypothetical protein GI582_22920 [Sulfitobacter sp. BDSS02]|nr:hypothetical protein [Sulfitobacter sp. BDSS02]